MELLIGDGADMNLGLNSAQEGGIDQGRRIEVGSKYDEHLERNLDLSPARQGEEVDAAIQRNHPAVEQFFGTDSLAAEVVNDQHTIVGLHLRRSGVILRDRIELQLEHLNRQLTAHQYS